MGHRPGSGHKHGIVRFIDQIDAQTLPCVSKPHIFGEPLQFLGGLQPLLESFLQLLKLFLLFFDARSFLWSASRIARYRNCTRTGLSGTIGIVID